MKQFRKINFITNTKIDMTKILIKTYLLIYKFVRFTHPCLTLSRSHHHLTLSSSRFCSKPTSVGFEIITRKRTSIDILQSISLQRSTTIISKHPVEENVTHVSTYRRVNVTNIVV